MSEEFPDWRALSIAEREAIVIPLWQDKKSATDIALRFRNASRSSVIGLVNRARKRLKGLLPDGQRFRSGWNITPKGSAHRATGKPRGRPAQKPNRNTVVFRQAAAEVAEIPQTSASADGFDPLNDLLPPLDGYPPISMLELPERAGKLCRYPVLGGYCGAPSGAEMYCTAHQRRIYTAEGIKHMARRSG